MAHEVHHVGFAVKSVEAALSEFAALGWVAEGDAVDDAARKVRILFMRLGASRIELAAPLSPDSPVSKFLARGGGPYHVCYEADSLEDAARGLASRGFVQFAKPAPAPAIANRRVAWFFSRSAGLVEVVERAVPGYGDV